MVGLGKGEGLRSERGVSLVQALVAVSVVVVGAFGVSQFATMTTDTMKKVVDVPTIVKVGNIGLGNARQVLLNVANPADGGRKTAGVCRVLTTPMRSGGAGRIDIELFATSENKFGPDWRRAFPPDQWERFSAPHCRPNGYKKCLRPNAGIEGLTAEDIVRLEPEVFIEMIPILVRKSVGDEQSAIRLPISEGTVVKENARDVAFLILATTRYTTEKSKDDAGRIQRRRVDKIARMAVWSGEAECEYVFTLDGEEQTVLINASAIGSGVDDQTLFSADDESLSDRLLRVIFPLTVRMESEVVVEDGRRLGTSIRTDESMASIACNENRFRCRGRSGVDREWAPVMTGAYRAIFNQMNPHRLASNVDVVPRYNFQTKGGAEINPDITYSTNDGPIDTRITLTTSWRTILMEIADGPGVCRNICAETGGTPYNWAADINTNTGIYFGNVLHRMPQVTVDGRTYREEDTDRKPVACSCCFMKQCGMRGVNVFGYCHKQPPEPLDSRVPECEGGTQSVVRTRQLTDNPMSGTGRCIAAKLEADGSLTYERRDCATSLRPLCFFQGTYRFAQDGITRDYIRSDFNGANEACYQMGRERLNRDNIDTLLAGQGNLVPADMPPVVGENYEFLNGAAAGFFIAPQDAVNVGMVEAGIRSVVGTDEWFWVNMRTSRARFRYAAAPDLPNTSEFSTESDQDGLLQFNRDPVHPFDTSGASVMMLMNTRRYFGALNVNPVQTAAPQHGICFDPTNNNIVRTALASANFSDMRNLCRGVNALFIPPVTPSQWTSSMMRAQPISPRRPWPIPTAARRGAWVALQRGGGRWQSSAAIQVTKFDPTSRDYFADNRKVYFVRPYGDALTNAELPMASAINSAGGASPRTPVEPTHYLCRTGDRANPFSIVPWSPTASCSQYFLHAGNAGLEGNSAGMIESRNAVIAMSQAFGIPEMLDGSKLIALNHYKRIPRCSSPDPDLGNGRYLQEKTKSCPLTGSETYRCSRVDDDNADWQRVGPACP